MGISVLPKTSLGRWSVGLAVVFILLSVLSGVSTRLGGVGSALVGLIVGAAFGISGIAAFITGLVGIIKSRERSILVFLAVAAGFFCLTFFLGEFLFPH